MPHFCKELTNSVSNDQCLWKVLGSYLLDFQTAAGATDCSVLEALSFFDPLFLGVLSILLRLKFSFFCLSLKCRHS